MIAFRERNPVPIGVAGLLVLGLAVVAAFNVDAIPFVGGGTRYAAAFSEAGGLREGDDVRIAGVKVGEVRSLGLDDGHVRVDFRVTEPAAFGATTGASIRIKTLLGQKFLSLEPAGPGQLPAGSEIPLQRTVSAYDVVEAMGDLATTTAAIDTGQLASALDTLATEFADTPEEVRGSLSGLSQLSRTIASRDDQLRQLLAHTRGVTGVLADRDAELSTLIHDAAPLLAELDRRREDIARLLDSTAALADQITQLVRENRAELRPALERLQSVLTVLTDNKAQLERGIAAMAPFTRVFANTLGTGRWFDTYIANITPNVLPAPPAVTP